MSNQQSNRQMLTYAIGANQHKRESLATARQRLAELLDADTYDCATLHAAARDLLNALEG